MRTSITTVSRLSSAASAAAAALAAAATAAGAELAAGYAAQYVPRGWLDAVLGELQAQAAARGERVGGLERALAGLDEGLLSLPLNILVYMENSYM